MTPCPPGESLLPRPANPIWTENKARLIERYLFYFVLVTHHGNYIDGFAGPQRPGKAEMWAARLALENEPRWLRRFFLFDVSKIQAARLDELVQTARAVPRRKGEPRREIESRYGDFNQLVHELLASERIPQKEATFCLLDQRTFECHWSTVTALARYKRSGNKVELFYFLPVAWLDRALSALRQDGSRLEPWWGRNDWRDLRGMSNDDRRKAFTDRFTGELGYRSAVPWPIFSRERGGRIMYYMIHATDHGDAPMLMSRAYSKAVGPKETQEQLRLELAPTLA